MERDDSLTSGRKPLLIWDGDCGFCREWIARLRRRTGDRVDYAASQDVAEHHPGIPRATFAESVVLVLPDGTWRRGAEAVFRALAESGRLPDRLPFAAYRSLPGFRPATELGYRMVASHRVAASRLTRLLHGAAGTPTTFHVSSALFLRLLGVVFLCAFASLWVQVDGLMGSRGILPVGPFIDAAREQLGGTGWMRVPTLCWWDPSDRFLHALCGGGVLASVLLVVGILRVPALVGVWAAYLSLVTAGRAFMTFQWDTLLLETAFLAIWIAPLGAWPDARRDAQPRAAARWLLWWLVFRLHFTSGVVKLQSGDPTWRDLTALRHHLETQPLPTWVAWHASQLPPALLQAACAAMFVVELGLPFLILGPRRVRHLAALGMLSLQAGIVLTGNYGFFNLLTAVLCLGLLDDGAWPAGLRDRLRPVPGAPEALRWPRLVLWPVAAVTLLLTTAAMLDRFGREPAWPAPVAAVRRATAPLLTWNAYGLFADMTTERPEIVLEGSDDGVLWKAYELPWKPGDPARRPEFLQPHVPRLDWRMWFAALGPPRASPWLARVQLGLLRGEPEILGLFERNPFPLRPPRMVRAVRWRYAFTDAAERKTTGRWWRREPVGTYAPPASLD